MSQRIRVHCINVSADGVGAGHEQSLDRPFGSDVSPGDLFFWLGATAHWLNRTDPGGTRGMEDYISRDYTRNIGAEIMGRNKFGPQRGPWENEDWTGWWGDEPPFHTPVFVLTHHPRPSFSLSDTTFHFLDATPQEAADRAKAAAEGQDVRLGGGVRTIREFLDAGLVDEMHIAVVPIELGEGIRLWDSSEELTDRYEHEQVSAPSGVTHHFFWRD
ncbi:dihydrofolate reductase family protein [Georgenia deserti]|uniref:Dihydrofolate reductase family protein n=1 Tax=Georgenia deserti TaxID=2093781 RepID=A0ABW4L7Q0_9MICO